MTNEEVKQYFSKAYAYMLSGDFAASAACFQHIIDSNRNSYEAHLAEQRLRWYCLPIQAVHDEMERTSAPVNISDVVVRSIGKVDAETIDYVSIVQSIEAELSKMQAYVRIGTNVWVLKKELSRCINSLVVSIRQSNEPVSVAEFVLKHWPDSHICCPNFPDGITVSILSSLLQEFQIDVISKGFALPSARIKSAVSRFRDCIFEEKTPLELDSYIHILFPKFSKEAEYLAPVREIVRVNLDQNFLRVYDGYWYLHQLLDFSIERLEEVFGDKLLPATTRELAWRLLLPDKKSAPNFPVSFLNALDAKLASHDHVMSIGSNTWILKSRLATFVHKSIATLFGATNIMTAEQIIRHVLGTQPSRDVLELYSNTLVKQLSKTKDVIGFKGNKWLHRSVLRQVIEISYQSLLEKGNPQTGKTLLNKALHTSKLSQPDIAKLETVFEEYLSNDDRFIKDIYSNKWRAVPSNAKHNELAVDVLQNNLSPMTFERIQFRITERFGVIQPILDLNHDDRFRIFRDDLWALNQWVFINDLALVFLASTYHPQYSVTIKSIVCEKHQIDPNLAIFIPFDDYRFAVASNNRWVARHFLTDEEIDECYQMLVRFASQGVRLSSLVYRILHKNYDLTDAEQCLPLDDRILFVEGMLYAKQAVTYYLNDNDLDKIAGYISSHIHECPIPIARIVSGALDKNFQFTDAEQKLREDDRFLEIYPGFWSPADYSPDNLERKSIGNVAVSNVPFPQSGDVTIPNALTKRKRRRRGETAATTEKVVVALSLLDIRYGNLHIPPKMQDWLPSEGNDYIEITDEKGFSFLGTLDETHSLLDIKQLLTRRGLTYGDKVRIEPRNGSLFICPTGERDTRVETEAARHEDIDRLVEEARLVKKSYHDLMIDVMEMIGGPLHREDIFQLVDYQRTAVRQSIFMTLSLVDCPYEELRYFVPEGNGYWSFSRERKEAYDMKMQELVDENASMAGLIVLLQDKLESTKMQVEKLQQGVLPDQQEREKMREELNQLRNQLTILQTAEQENQSYRHGIEEGNIELQLQVEKLNEELSTERKNLADISTYRDTLAETIKTLEGERDALSIKMEEYSRDITDLTDKSNAAAEMLKKADNKIQVLETGIEDLQNKLQASEQRANDISAKVATLEQAKAELEASYSQLIADYELAKKSNEQVFPELEALQSQYSDLQQSSSESTAAFLENLEARNSEIIALQLQVAQLARLENQLSEARTDAENLRLSLASEKQVHTLEIQRLQAELEEINSVYERLKQDNETGLATLQEENEQLKERIASLLNLHTEEKHQITQELEGQVQRLSAFNANQTKEIRKLQKRLEKIHAALNTRFGKVFAMLTHLDSEVKKG